MKKFTVFTIILTIIVIVVFGEVIVNEYLPDLRGANNSVKAKLSLPKNLDIKKSITTNVLGSDLTNHLGDDKSEDGVVIGDGSAGNGADVSDGVSDSLTFKNPVNGTLDPSGNPIYLDPNAFSDDGNFLPNDSGASSTGFTGSVKSGSSLSPKDFEDDNFVSTGNNIYLRDEQIKSAGFVGGYLEKEPFDGRLFKTVLVDDLTDVTVERTVIRSKDALLAKVYIFKIGLNANVNEVYELLKLRAAQGLNIRINETNEYGLNSFYMNDPARSDTAFLTVRISGFIYSFSYPKAYHSQVKNLIKLIEWEY